MTAIGTLRNTTKDTLREVLTRLQTEGAALGHFNVADHVKIGDRARVAAAAGVMKDIAPGSGQVANARAWIATGAIAPGAGPRCTGCHR